MRQAYDLHDYQKRIAIDAAERSTALGGLLEPGLGKTITALTAFMTAKRHHGVESALVVAPKNACLDAWFNQYKEWNHTKDLIVALVVGTPAQRKAAINLGADIYVVNNENLVWLLEEMTTLPDMLIIDESHNFKDPSTKRFKALRKRIDEFTFRSIWTGSPTPESLVDLWSQVYLLDGGARLGKNITRFRTDYCEPAYIDRRTNQVHTWKVRPSKRDELLERVSDICFSLRAQDYLSLPDCTFVDHRFEFDAATRKLYRDLKKDHVANLGGTEITAVSAGAVAQKLWQLTSGAIYDTGFDGKSLDTFQRIHDLKIERLRELIAAGIPTLVFTHFRHSQLRLAEEFPMGKTLDGDAIAEWQQGSISLAWTHPKSGGVGLNLQRNDCPSAQIVWFDITPSGKDYQQGNARIHRQGQRVPVVVHHLLVERSVDEPYLMAAQGKLTEQEANMEALK